MAVSYNRLWKLLIDRKISKADFTQGYWNCTKYNDQTA